MYQKDSLMLKRSLSAVRIITVILAGTIALIGCDNSVKTAETPAKVAVPTEKITTKPAENTAPAPVTAIDWSKVASSEQPADTTNYPYPFAIDSQNVQNYADYFKVDNATAQHNLTIGMASNEALSKVLDQLGNRYVSHEVTDGENATLTIHTMPEVTASEYDYVFSEDFAKGLVLPIKIVPDGVKDETVVNPHEEMAE